MKTNPASLFAPAAGSALLLAGLGLASLAPVAADPLPYGPDTCISGFVWREAIPSDHVCVTPEIRTLTAKENAEAGGRVDPTGPYGSSSCKPGYVWRNAFNGDAVCVPPDVRDRAAAENAEAASRVAH